MDRIKTKPNANFLKHTVKSIYHLIVLVDVQIHFRKQQSNIVKPT